MDKRELWFQRLCHCPRELQATGRHREERGEGPGGTDTQPHHHRRSQLSGKRAVGEQRSKAFPRTPLVKSRT